MALKSVRCFLIMTMILGILIGIQIKSPYQISSDGSFIMRDTITKINKERIESYALMKQKKAYEREIEKLEEKASDENEALMEYKDKADYLKNLMAYTSVEGPGIRIIIDTHDDRNLAYLMEERKLFIILVTELKSEGCEAISINGQRINSMSEITLAGNHININAVAIAPPYEVNAIGNSAKLLNYVNTKSPIIDIMRNGYNLSVNFKVENSLILPKLDYIKSPEYIKEVL